MNHGTLKAFCCHDCKISGPERNLGFAPAMAACSISKTQLMFLLTVSAMRSHVGIFHSSACLWCMLDALIQMVGGAPEPFSHQACFLGAREHDFPIKGSRDALHRKIKSYKTGENRFNDSEKPWGTALHDCTQQLNSVFSVLSGWHNKI